MRRDFNELAPKIIEQYSLKKKTEGEYGNAPCPNCGGTDRFWINNAGGELKHHCRQHCDFLERDRVIQQHGLLPSVGSPLLPQANNVRMPYHVQKNIDLEGSGAVLDGDVVIIDLVDLQSGKFAGTQRIQPDGSKKFSAGMSKVGIGALIGEPSDRTYVVEGWADAVVVNRATGQQACFALDAHTLPATAKMLATFGHNVIVAADNDVAGLKAAQEANLPYAVPTGVKDWWDLQQRSGQDAVRAALAVLNDPNQLRLFDHVLDISTEPPKFTIQGILVEHSMAAIVAPSYVGKSYMAVDMACSVATGVAFHGRQVEHGNVFYVIGEGRYGIRRRVQAWCRDRNVRPSRDRIKLHFSKQGLNFLDPASIEALRNDLQRVPDVKLIVIDTLARSFGGGDENTSRDMGQFINACDALMHEFGATILIVHHMGKDKNAGARGHSSFFGALDTCMTMKKIGAHDVQLICEKQKDYPEFDPMQFVFVTLGGDDDTPVFEMVPTSTRPNTPRLGKNEQLAMDTFYEATKSMPASCRLHLEVWRSAFVKRHTGDTDKAKNDAFSRARRDLVSKGFLTADNDFYGLGDKATNGDIRQNVAGQNSGNGDATDTPL